MIDSLLISLHQRLLNQIVHFLRFHLLEFLVQNFVQFLVLVCELLLVSDQGYYLLRMCAKLSDRVLIDELKDMLQTGLFVATGP